MKIQVIKECCDCGGLFLLDNVPNLEQAKLLSKADKLCPECWIIHHAVPAYVELALQHNTTETVQSFPA